MRTEERQPLRVAIACGGTGGHLFPGLAVAEQLLQRGCRVTLMVSGKEVDQAGLGTVEGMEKVVLPAVGLTSGQGFAFARGLGASYRVSKREFAERPPQAALAMGGFTSASPILAAKRFRARTFLHESNAVPGRANRWLSWLVNCAFVGFPAAAGRLHTRRVAVTGTPVRRKLQPGEAATCRKALGLDPARPMGLVMGGSQGASAINRLMTESLARFAAEAPEWQWLHLAGPNDADQLRAAYTRVGMRAQVHDFFGNMEMALGGAELAISRAGASSLAELAAMRIPSLLIPYPAAADQHQLLNARTYEESGAARLITQEAAAQSGLAAAALAMMKDAPGRLQMRSALAQWHAPRAAEQIAETILAAVGSASGKTAAADTGPGRRSPKSAGQNGAKFRGPTRNSRRRRSGWQPQGAA